MSGCERRAELAAAERPERALARAGLPKVLTTLRSPLHLRRTPSGRSERRRTTSGWLEGLRGPAPTFYGQRQLTGPRLGEAEAAGANRVSDKRMTRRAEVPGPLTRGGADRSGHDVRSGSGGPRVSSLNLVIDHKFKNFRVKKLRTL